MRRSEEAGLECRAGDAGLVHQMYKSLLVQAREGAGGGARPGHSGVAAC